MVKKTDERVKDSACSQLEVGGQPGLVVFSGHLELLPDQAVRIRKVGAQEVCSIKASSTQKSALKICVSESCPVEACIWKEGALHLRVCKVRILEVSRPENRLLQADPSQVGFFETNLAEDGPC